MKAAILFFGCMCGLVTSSPSQLLDAATQASLYLPMTANMGTYPGYAGDFAKGNVTVYAGGESQPLVLVYSLTGLEPNTTGGVHIHQGTSCSVGAGPHWWRPASYPDPWKTTMWTSDANGDAFGEVMVSGQDYIGNGYNYSSNLGHAVVIHNSAGTKTGCGVLEADVQEVVDVSYTTTDVQFNLCGDNVSVAGGVVAINATSFMTTKNNAVTSAQVRDVPAIAFNGTAGKYYTVIIADLVLDETNIPGKSYGEYGQYLHYLVANVPGEQATSGFDGLPDTVPYQSIPGTANPHPVGVYVFEQAGIANFTDMLMSLKYYKDGNYNGAPPPAKGFALGRVEFDVYEFAYKNSLGAMMGFNFFTVFFDLYGDYLYASPMDFNLSTAVCPDDFIEQGLSNATATGLLMPLVAAMGPYPQSLETPPTGSVTLQVASGSVPMTVQYNLQGLEANAMGGVHVHQGMSCDNATTVGGHYYNAVVGGDPWSTMWASDGSGAAVGNFTVWTGYGFDQNIGHAVVLHNSKGTRVGCGVLGSTLDSGLLVTYYAEALSYTACNNTYNTSGTVAPLDISSEVGHGNTLSVVQVRNEPVVTILGQKTGLYTLMMVDHFGVAFGFPQQGAGNYFHWGMVNIDGAAAVTGVQGLGDTLLEYFGPANPNNVPHQYTYYLYEQTSEINVTQALAMLSAGKASEADPRSDFDQYGFIAQMQLGPLVAMSYATVFTDPYANYISESNNLNFATCASSLVTDLTTKAAEYGLEYPASATQEAFFYFDTPSTTVTACNMTQYFNRSVVAINAGSNANTAVPVFVSTEAAQSPPTVFFAGDEMKNYTVMLRDDDFPTLHWMVVNVPGAGTATGVYGFGDNVVGPFPPTNPSPYPHNYVLTVYEQSMYIMPTAASAALAAVSVTVVPVAAFGTTVGAGASRQGMMTVAATLGLGEPIAFNWATVYTDIVALNSFNNLGLGDIAGSNITCPNADALAIQANLTTQQSTASILSGNMGFGFDLSALTTTIGISFFGAPVSMELPYFSLSLPLSFVSVNPGVVDGDFNGENNVVTNANQLREPPLVSAPYLNVKKNYTVMMFSADSVTDSSSLVWVACNLGATQLGFMDAAMTDVGLVVAPFQSLPFDFVGSVTTLVFEQTSNVAVVPTQTRAIPSTTLNLKLHAESITGVLLKPVAINWASVSPPSACLAANGVSLVGGQCLPDCTALLRLRRACSSCGTVSYAFSLVEPTTDITNMTDFANQVRNEIAGYLGLAPSAVAVTVDGSTVSVILAKTSEASLNTKVSTGQLPLQYNGKTFTSEALVIATTAATTLSTPSGSFSSQGPSATTSLQPTVSTSATATGPVSTPNGTASTTAVPSASTSSDSGGATAAIIIIVLLLLLIVGYLLLRKFGILEGSYCGGRVHLNPWSVSFDRMTNSCNKRTSSAGKNPYEAGRSTVSNPTYTDVSPDAPRGRTDSVA